jgi:tetratricopeptide (TPR) repeat protein
MSTGRERQDAKAPPVDLGKIEAAEIASGIWAGRSRPEMGRRRIIKPCGACAIIPARFAPLAPTNRRGAAMIRAGCRWLAGAGVVLALAAMPADAQTNQQVTWCENRDFSFSSDQQIKGCTAVIQSGNYSGHSLAVAFSNRCGAWRDKGDLDSALDDCNQSLKLDRNYAGAYVNRGNVWDDKHDEDRALADYSEAIRLDPKDANAYDMRANAHSANGDHDLAIADYNRSLRLNPNDPTTYNNRCDELLQVRQYKAALEDCNESLRMRPNHANTLQHRGNAYLALGELDEAIADYDASVRLYPRSAWTLYGRGLAKKKRGDPDAQADIDAAEAMSSNIASSFAKAYGVR